MWLVKMLAIALENLHLQLLSEKAIYLEDLGILLVSDVHLGKSETFQAAGIPIANKINQTNLERLQQLCSIHQPKQLIILGDLFHSKFALVDEVLIAWTDFLAQLGVEVHLLLGNHDRAFLPQLQQFSMHCTTAAIQLEQVILSHEPLPRSPTLNICGHVHPCLRLKTRLDHLRLPCFYYNQPQNQLILPAFGEFTGGYEITLKPGAIAYVIADNAVIPFKG